VSESVERSVAGVGAFELRPLRLVTFPERGRPRLIAMETDAPPALLEVQRRLVHRLARSSRTKTGDRFRPHLTLMRFTGAAQPRDVDAPVELPPFRVEALSLMRSILRPAGAEHAEVARFALSEHG
jgi:2'-5' RNA ligase